VTQKVKLTNCIRGLLKTFGIILGGGKGRRFEAMVRERIVENPMLTMIIEPMLVVLLVTRRRGSSSPCLTAWCADAHVPTTTCDD
jgi:hypothetical protein